MPLQKTSYVLSVGTGLTQLVPGTQELSVKYIVVDISKLLFGVVRFFVLVCLVGFF